MKLAKRILTFFLLITLVNCSEEGTIGLKEFGNITGRVVKKETFEAIENAKVTLSRTNNTVFTDANGNFKFDNVEAKDYSVEAQKEGYLNKFEGVVVTKDNTVNVVLEMDISTANNRPPSKPELQSPTDNQQNIDSKVELQWASTDPDNDTLKYTIKVTNDFNDEEIVINDYTETKYELENLKYGAKYYWQVTVNDGVNSDVLSETFTFVTKDFPDNRYFYTKNENGNNVIYSASYNATDEVAENEYKLTDSNLNSWRPRKNNASNLIAFLRTDNNQTHIYTMKLNGEGVTKVTSSVPVSAFNLNEVDFSWSSDGSKIIYPSFDKLYKINKDGTGLQMMYQTTDGSLITECDWSDDGSKIALKTNNSDGYNAKIYVIDMSGNILSTILSGMTGAAGGLNFSATGNKLLYTRDISGFESTNYRQLNTQIFLYDITAATSVNLSTDKPDGTNDLDVRFSPNEAEVIFMNTSNDGISQKNIWKTNVNTTGTGNRDRKQLFINAMMPDFE